MNHSDSNTDARIYMAPLQGFTDYAYRTSYFSIFGTPDAAFSPYIETHKPDHRVFRDVLPERNKENILIPQILGNNASEMLFIIKQLEEMGYKEINWNLGCPYPMVTKKTMGAGLLPLPDRINQILEELFNNINCRLSVKMRLGLTNSDDWSALVQILNRYPLSEIIIHSRTAAQMYKGEVDISSFVKFSEQLKAPVCYNGNIFKLEHFSNLKNQLIHITRWMLGRGLLANPLLMQEIRTGQKAGDEEIRKALEQLHNHLLNANINRLSGSSHILNKMKPYWEYFSESLPGCEKGLKKIKKSITLDTYKVAVNEIFRG